jgi:uncharacterized membrane protein YfcA
MQLFFALLNAASIAAKGMPTLTGLQLVTAFGALATGVVTGQLVARRVDPRHARSAVVAVALAGAFATVVKGALAW